MKPTINPDNVTFLPWRKGGGPNRRLLLAKVYQKPERTEFLYLPEAFLDDTTGTLWEVVRASDGAKEIMGTRDIREGDIVKVRGLDYPTGSGMVDERDGRHLVFIDAERVYQLLQVGRDEV